MCWSVLLICLPLRRSENPTQIQGKYNFRILVCKRQVARLQFKSELNEVAYSVELDFKLDILSKYDDKC